MAGGFETEAVVAAGYDIGFSGAGGWGEGEEEFGEEVFGEDLGEGHFGWGGGG